MKIARNLSPEIFVVLRILKRDPKEASVKKIDRMREKSHPARLPFTCRKCRCWLEPGGPGMGARRVDLQPIPGAGIFPSPLINPLRRPSQLPSYCRHLDEIPLKCKLSISSRMIVQDIVLHHMAGCAEIRRVSHP